MKVRLFLENNEVELNDDVTICLNRQFDEITNPTVIINDWSKTVKIPMTKKNNQIFNHLYNPDRINGDGEGMFGNFNPHKRIQFRLEYNDNVIMTGYCKVIDISKGGNGVGTYNCTLFGQLGNVFQEFSKITFDPLQLDDPKYVIDGSSYVDIFMNKETIKEFWERQGQHALNIDDPMVDVKDIVGFCPNNSYCENFDYKTYQVNSTRSEKFSNTLGNDFQNSTGIAPDTVINNGMLPREIGEYRSYLQLPYIYFNKLFQIFQKKAEDVTGYKFNLDNEWFSDLNPYYFNLVYMLKRLEIKKATQKENHYQMTVQSSYLGDWMLSGDYSRQLEKPIYVKTVDYENEPIFGVETSYSPYNHYFKILQGDKVNETFHLRIPIYLNDYAGGANDSGRIKEHMGIKVEVSMVSGKASGNYDINPVMSTQTNKFLIVDKNGSSINPSDYPGYEIIYCEKATKPTGEEPKFMYLDNWFSVNSKYDGERCKLKVKTSWTHNEYPLRNKSGKGEVVLWLGTTSAVSAYGEQVSLTANVGEGSLQSNSRVILNDMWDNSFGLFDEILNYCKMYRIAITVDDFHKTINFIPLYKYFSNYSIEDWTDKVDMGKEYTLTPITWEDKYIMFNYEKSDIQLNTTYSDEFGAQYGEKRINTNYNFNSNTNNLFKGCKLGMVSTDNVLSWNNLYNNKKVLYSFPAETSVSVKDKDSKYKNCFGQYFFFNKLAAFDTDPSMNLRSVKLSDDTPFQQINNTFFYSQSVNTIGVNSYPMLDVYFTQDGDDDTYVCLFNVPQRDYTYLKRKQTQTNGIYNIFWKNFIEERYNSQNKKLTCYVRLTPQDYSNFEFNKFVTIENQLYFVNKIYDYNVESNGSTKVDLLTISDVSKYHTIGKYKKDTPTEIVVDSTSGGFISGNIVDEYYRFTYARSYNDINFSNGSKRMSVGGLDFVIEEIPWTHVNTQEWNYRIMYRKASKFNQAQDASYSLTVSSSYDNKVLTFTRYRDYPNPPVMFVDLEDDKIPAGSGQFYIEVRTQYDPEPTISYGGVDGLCINTYVEWEDFNDDYVYRKGVVNYRNTRLGTESSTYISVTTGSGYTITKGLTVGAAPDELTMCGGSQNPYIPGDVDKEDEYTKRYDYVYSVSDLTFGDGSTEITVGGLQLAIRHTDWTVSGKKYNYEIVYKKVDGYNGATDKQYSFIVKNKTYSNTCRFIRYSDYPYPPTMSIYGDNNGSIKTGTTTLNVEVMTQFEPQSIEVILNGTQTGKVFYTIGEWEGTEHDGHYQECNVIIMNSQIGLNGYEGTMTIKVVSGSGYELISRTYDMMRSFKRVVPTDRFGDGITPLTPSVTPSIGEIEIGIEDINQAQHAPSRIPIRDIEDDEPETGD